MSYRAPGESLAGRIARFYMDNPDEEMTYSDLAKKFECTPAKARHAVKDLAGRGLLESVHVIRRREKGIAA